MQVVLGHQFNSASKWLLGDLVLDAGEAEAVIRDRYDFGPREPLTVTVPLEGQTTYLVHCVVCGAHVTRQRDLGWVSRIICTDDHVRYIGQCGTHTSAKVTKAHHVKSRAQMLRECGSGPARPASTGVTLP